MLFVLAIILVIAWLGGFLVMHVSSAAIHLLLLFAVISVVAHFVRGRRTSS
ncbi:MAG TPA: lmo0937 family membrane protein [Polyangia bacterium]|nr:lmo0937 family membrane protein [Polyangia bacterium]